jgi:hypothetical protein
MTSYDDGHDWEAGGFGIGHDLTTTNCDHYSPMPSGGSRATKEGMCITSEFEAVRTRVQRAFASSSVNPMLHLDQRIFHR